MTDGHTPPLHFGGNHDQGIILPRYANRHGLIAGATGTGKTVTLQVLCETFSRLGVPSFAADVKGDLSGIAAAGKDHPKITERVVANRLEGFQLEAAPVELWDVYGEHGNPIRTTISEMGPMLLSRLLDLNETQEGVLHIAFRVADEQGLLLLDLKDLRAMLTFVGQERKAISNTYGNVATASLAAIQRRLLVLEDSGGEHLFGEPSLDLNDLLRTASNGQGVVNLLDARRLLQNPRLYSSFLLWMLAELFEDLPEAGDLEKPKLVFFFDEAHLLFDDASDELLDQVERVVRLIRSKGVGVFFVTQHPSDIPEAVQGQIGHRIQHALRAYTPKDRRTLRAAADSMVANPEIDVEQALTTVGVGEALVSLLGNKGIPQPVQQVLINPPRSRIGPLTDTERAATVTANQLASRYQRTVDRESAFERLQSRAEQKATQAAAEPTQRRASTSRRQSSGEAFIKSAARSIGTQLGRTLIRGLLGALKR